MPRDGGIGDVGQAQFAKDALLFLLGLVGELAGRKKSAERQLENFVARDGGFERAADERSAAADNGHLDAFRTARREKRFFRGRTLPAKRAALPKRKLFAELRFGEPGKREVEIVAAEQKVPADGRARELDAIAFAIDAD